MTRKLLAICLLAAAPLFSVAQTMPPSSVVAGEVLEVQNIEGYSYLRLKTAQGETWAAVPTAAVKKGAKVTIENAMVMNNFESKALKRKFDKVVFGTLASGPAAGTAAVPQSGGPHALAKGPEVPDVKVPKATGPNARTVGEIMTKSAELKDKPVLVRAKIVKINSGIRGVNWIHLRDGSGSAADQTNDLIITSVEEPKVGDIVTMQGVVRTNKDFGAGYTYKVIVEEGKVKGK